MRFGIVGSSSGSSSSSSSSSSDSEDEVLRKKLLSIPEPLGIDRYGEIEGSLGYVFSDRHLLQYALTHRSVQMRDTKTDYERLEFLGDAVLDLAVAHLLIDRHPNAKEGELSKMRAALVNAQSLALIARGMNLGRFIRLSRGELASGGAERSSILADVLEAILGAVYTDGGAKGYEAARASIEKLLGDQLLTVTPRDPKTELQEALHALGSESPVYRLECVEGPEHSPVFISVVEVDGQIVGRGRGATKKASQQAAAEEALTRVKPGDALDSTFLTSEPTLLRNNEQGNIQSGEIPQTADEEPK